MGGERISWPPSPEHILPGPDVEILPSSARCAAPKSPSMEIYDSIVQDDRYEAEQLHAKRSRNLSTSTLRDPFLQSGPFDSSTYAESAFAQPRGQCEQVLFSPQSLSLRFSMLSAGCMNPFCRS